MRPTKSHWRTHRVDPILEDVTENIDVHFERIVRYCPRKFGYLAIKTVVAKSKFWLSRRYVDRKAEIDVVIFDWMLRVAAGDCLRILA